MSGLEGINDKIESISDLNQDKIDKVGVRSEPPAVECPKVEAEYDSDDLPTKALNSAQQKKELEKAGELVSSTDAKETVTHHGSPNESDGSDIVEQDVSIVACTPYFDISLLNEAVLLLIVLKFC